jgi:phosphatidylserine/phosphatidylglycerophosphate/cardiolipin synthase-like enzyme
VIIDDAVTKAEVQARFDAYETALMTNDLDALDDFFWPSPLALRFGAGESLFGFDAIAAFRAARGGSPQRSLRNSQITTFGPDHAVATTEFLRAGEPRIGRQTQVWVKFPETGWRIVSAHVSLVAEKS